jgi:hypothetical protein
MEDLKMFTIKRACIAFSVILIAVSAFYVVDLAFSGADPADLQAKCIDRCTNGKSGCISNCKGNLACQAGCAKHYKECLKGCKNIESCGKDFQKCIKNAKTQKAKEACRKGYVNCKKK